MTIIDWAGGPGPVAIYEPPHPLALTAAECDALVSERVDGWINEGVRQGRRIEDPALWDLVVEPLTVANTLRWRHDVGVGDETVRHVLRYLPGGYMPLHADRQNRWNHDEITVSLVAQLSDGSAYTGGDVEFAVDGEVIRLPRARGTVAVFDSTLKHRVKTVTSGTRWSLTVFGRPSPGPPVGEEMIGYEPPNLTPLSGSASLLTVCPVIVPPADGLLESWDHDHHLVVINGDSDAWRRRCQERGWSYVLDRYGRNLGCPASWNLAFERASEVSATHVAILSQGCVLADGTKQLASILAKHPQAPWIEVAGGVEQPWHCRVISVAVWERVGGFDETLPIWCDVDFSRCVWLTGKWDGWSRHAVRVELAARDVRNSAVRGGAVPAYAYDVDRQRYATKWGGPHNEETYARPWDASSASPGVLTPPQVLAHGGFAALLQTAQIARPPVRLRIDPQRLVGAERVATERSA